VSDSNEPISPLPVHSYRSIQERAKEARTSIDGAVFWWFEKSTFALPPGPGACALQRVRGLSPTLL
jgi:hypothetical protein